jgi:hypothetical protein
MALDDAEEAPIEWRRLDAEWLALTAVREAIGVGRRSTGGKDPAYAEVLDFAADAAPELFGRSVSALARAQETPLAQEYRERAQAESSLQRRKISPLDLINRDIALLERLTDVRESRLLAARLAKLHRTRDVLDERPFSEHKVIFRDVLSAKRPDLPTPPIHRTDHTEYPLPFRQALRIRILHPDKPEHATGADLLYEFCDQNTRLARLAFVQYKMWDGKSLRFAAAGNLEDQLHKLQCLTCSAGLCESSQPAGVRPAAYRLPHCSSFLRPTDRLQSADATMISSGIHVPVCVAVAVPVGQRGGKVLKNETIRSRAISQHSFEELFGRAMLGSRGLPYAEVEQIYRENNIFNSSERIVVHAQQYNDAA